MENDAADLKGVVQFLGHIGNPHELADILGGCELFLHPNPKEPFGIAPLEAMACGLVLVAPNSGGITEYANQDNAMLVDAEPLAFAQAVRTLLQQPALLAAEVVRGRKDRGVIQHRAHGRSISWIFTKRSMRLREAACRWARRTAFCSTAPAPSGKEVRRGDRGFVQRRLPRMGSIAFTRGSNMERS